MQCEMCGKNIEKSILVDIEGAHLKVCSACASMGKRLNAPKSTKYVQKKKRTHLREEFVEDIVSGFGKKIKDARESKGLKQEVLAQKLAIKESLLHQIESEHIKPRIDLARKLERFFNIKLVEKVKIGVALKSSPGSGRTIGDIIGDKLNLK